MFFVFDFEIVIFSNFFVVIGNILFISCLMFGIFFLKIIWYKNGEVVFLDLDFNIRIYVEGRRLELISVRVIDFGLYRCEGVNVVGDNYNEYEVEVYGMLDFLYFKFFFKKKKMKSLDFLFLLNCL